MLARMISAPSVAEILRRHPGDGGARPDRHEDRRLDPAVRGLEGAAPRARGRVAGAGERIGESASADAREASAMRPGRQERVVLRRGADRDPDAALEAAVVVLPPDRGSPARAGGRRPPSRRRPDEDVVGGAGVGIPARVARERGEERARARRGSGRHERRDVARRLQRREQDGGRVGRDRKGGRSAAATAATRGEASRYPARMPPRRPGLGEGPEDADARVRARERPVVDAGEGLVGLVDDQHPAGLAGAVGQPLDVVRLEELPGRAVRVGEEEDARLRGLHLREELLERQREAVEERRRPPTACRPRPRRPCSRGRPGPYRGRGSLPQQRARIRRFEPAERTIPFSGQSSWRASAARTSSPARSG